ncbi:MAG: FN3 associated domain-containing protein, partial [Victivallales bacterium]
KGQKIELTKAPSNALYQASAMTVLVQAYVITRKDEYLKRWAEYMDDWAINSNYADSIHPCFVSDGANSGGGGFVGFTRLMAGLAAIMPEDREIIPPATFARIVKKYLSEYVLPPIAYIKSNTHNWTPGGGLMLVSMYYDEFKVSPALFRHCRRRNIEDNAVTQNLRDGTENQQCPWYNNNYLGVYEALRLVETRSSLQSYYDLPWINELRKDIQWKNEIREHLGERINYFLRIRTPQGEHPIPIRGGDKRTATGIPAGDLYDMSPETYNIPLNSQIYYTFTSPGSGIRPEGYDSDWFPYGGYNIVREGWEKDSGYASLFCSPHPGAYGGFRSRSNNNSFGLAAFGQDLLVDDSNGHYMYPGSPILVDGKNQFFHAGYYKVEDPARHKVYQVSAWLEPSPWRWHASSNFNLMEGVYAGPWANQQDAPPKIGPDGKTLGAQPNMPVKNTLQGITHQRMVQYVRAANLWIVTDRMLADKPHDYEQVWRIATKPCDIPTFNEGDIKINAAAKTIITQAGEKPQDKKEIPKKSDMSMYQFCSQPLDYKTKTIAKDPKNHYQSCSRLDVSVKWKGAGNQQIVTAVYPRKAYEGADLKSIKQLDLPAGVNGFEALTQDGVKVLFASSANPNADIALGDVKIKGESLLLTQGVKVASNGERGARKEGENLYGVALGCTQMTVNGKTIEIPSADFEFTSDISSLPATRSFSFLPIYRPIDPVKIYPEQNVFAGEIEVKLSSATKGVEIRYTVDGTEPEIGSALYNAPFKINKSSVVKAKAFRPGLKSNPEYMSGTYSTPVSFGVFSKTEMLEPVKAANAKSGLDYKYYEGDWKKMWLFMDDLKPLATGTANELFDLSILPAGNKPIGDKAAPRQKFFTIEYNGFLNVPEDGVYTLHAPKEYVWPDTDPGYELNVYLGNNIVPYGGRTRIAGINQWYPSTRLHAFGNWSLALKKGLQPFRLVYLDYRTDAPSLLNKPGIQDYIWSGVTPDLRISGPGLDRQTIPKAWLFSEAKK